MYKTCYIYELIDPVTNVTRYIGKTIDLKLRFEKHIWEAKKGKKSYKNNWVKGLLEVNLTPIINIIDEVLESEWQFWEQFYIDLYKSWEIKLTNLTSGGEGCNGYKWTEENKRNFSVLMKGRKKPEGFSEQLGIRMRKTAKERGLKISESKKVPVVQIDAKTDKIMKTFNSIKKAQEKTGINGNISSVCNGKRPFAGGFKWRYLEDVVHS